MAPKTKHAAGHDGVELRQEGHWFFCYKPKVEQELPESNDDIQRLTEAHNFWTFCDLPGNRPTAQFL
jgi:hypothetical protein